jgi:tetratricopeptide (TPR) repeat protein
VARLLIYKGGRLEREMDLAERDLRIGRGAENEIHLEDPTKAVSRFHAELRFENGQYVLLDLNSQNGTWLGGQRVQRAGLEPGMQVVIGPYTLEYPALEGTASIPRPDALPDTAVPGGLAPSATETQRLTIERPTAARPPSTPAKAAPPPDPKRRAGINPISMIARPAVLLAAFGLVFLVLLAAVLFGPDEPAAPGGTEPQVGTTTPAPPLPTPAAPRTNEEMIASYLAEGRALVEKGEYERAISDHLDRLLVIDRNHAEALALKARAEEALRAGPVETPAPVAEVTPTPAPSATTPTPAPRRAVDPAVQRRNAELQRRYNEAMAAFNAGEFTLAIAGFEGIMRDEPGYRQTAEFIAKSRDAVREAAMTAYTQAAAAQERGEWQAAIAGYTRAIQTAAQIDEVIKGAAEARTKAQEHMKALAEDAMRRARQYDAVGRTREAIEAYEQVVDLLPPGDPTRKVAADRLAALRAGRE